MADHFRIVHGNSLDAIAAKKSTAAGRTNGVGVKAKEEMPIEIGRNRCRILARDADGHLKYYYADTAMGAVLAAMEGESDA